LFYYLKETMISYSLIILFTILLINYFLFLQDVLKGLNNLKPCEEKVNDEFVSVIVPFRNESENILASLKSLSGQNYPKNKFEIIFVNDSSVDDSLQKLNLNNNHENVRVLSVPDDYNNNSNKKRAIQYGIENSNGEIIVTTDADCFHSKNWLITLMKCMNEKTGFVSGPVEFIDGSNLFSKFQKLEFAGLVLTGAGLIGANKPAICNAANIAYRKKLFNDVGGFNDKIKLSSGDDELLLQKIWKESDHDIKFCWNHNAIVKTSPNKTLKEFYHQRKRWASKGIFYGSKKLVLKLILIYLFYVGLIIQLALSVFISKIYIILFIISISLKFIMEFKVLKRGEKLISIKRIIKFFPIVEILQIPYIIFAGFSGLFGNFNWKERKIKR